MKEIRLHGGPWHGRLVTVHEGRDHFHIISPVTDVTDFDRTGDEPPSSIETREGTYSVVRYSPYDFEWDGWRSHD